jgi:hypothetical protein
MLTAAVTIGDKSYETGVYKVASDGETITKTADTNGNAIIANFSKKINECQTNTINSTTNDTVANWGKQNTSIHFYGTSGLLNN